MQKLIILGAGASLDFGFPTGTELSKMIHSVWGGPNEKYIDFFIKAISKNGKKISDSYSLRESVEKRIKYLSERFYYAGAASIDDFLSTPLDDFEISFGKLTILDLILEKERISTIARSEKKLFQWENNWLRILFGQEFKFGSEEKLEEKITKNPVKFITFNYDRSLEQFIFTAIKNYYNLESKKAAGICKKIEFYHVYGKLAPLDWELEDPHAGLKFGDDLKEFLHNPNEKLYNCTFNIKVINEDRGDKENLDSTLTKYKTLVQEADKVYILGFGFLESNYKLLGIDEYKKPLYENKIPRNKFYYTTLGLSESVKSEIIKKMGSDNIYGPLAMAYNSSIYDYILHYY